MKTVCAVDNFACLADKAMGNPFVMGLIAFVAVLFVYNFVLGNVWKD